MIMHLYVSGPFMSLIGHPLLDACQLLLQISHLMLVKFCQVIELVFQTLISASRSKRMQKY